MAKQKKAPIGKLTCVAGRYLNVEMDIEAIVTVLKKPVGGK